MDVIVAQIKQILNSYLTKNVNTSDRVIDSALVLISLAFFDFVLSFLKNYITKLSSKNTINMGKEPWEIDLDTFKCDTIENIIKYKYCILFDGTFNATFTDDNIKKLNIKRNYENSYLSLLKIWIKKFSKSTLMVNVNGTTKYYMTEDEIQLYTDGETDNTILMPIWCYKKNDKFECIYLYGNNIYSNDISEFLKFKNHFLKYISTLTIENEHKKNLVINTISKNKSTYGNKQSFVLDFNNYVNTKKTFDTLYIDNKKEILDLIDKFANNKLYPPSYHLDNKLGLLLHGPPGTGKSGFVSCLANKLQRSILLIESLNEKKEIIFDAITKYKKTHIIVLDEFDKLLENIGKIDESDYSGIFTMASPEEKKQIINKISANKKSELSDVLFLMKLLDSFGDDSDRIIVATTNHPEKIPPALIRPGRFDKIICMSYCNFDMFKDISRGKFENIDELLEDNDVKNEVEKVLKLNITPLVLINTCVTSDTFSQVLNKLGKMKQKKYDNEVKEEE